MALSVAAIVASEVLARVVALRIIDDVRHQRLADLPAYGRADYDVRHLIDEIGKADPIQYLPYVMWRRKPFDGDLINVEQTGLRRTRGNSQHSDPLQVWVFGGSTIWGWGVPDEQTIPSHLARLLNETWEVDSQVWNYGEDGFVSTQEVIQLLRVLQSGRRPDVVVFYDGANDATAAALWPSVPGTHHNLSSIRSKLEGTGPSWSERARSLGLFRVARYALRQLGKDADSTPLAAPANVRDEDSLARQALDVWLENRQIVVALGRTYGFVPVFTFQPILGSTGKPLDESEQRLLATSMTRSTGPGLLVHERMRELLSHDLANGNETLTAVYDMSDVFQAVNEPLYLDWAHVSGDGNRIVAKRILDILQGEVCVDAPPRVGEATTAQLSAACAAAQPQATHSTP